LPISALFQERPWDGGFIVSRPYEVKATTAILACMGRKISIRRAVATDADEMSALFSAALKSMPFFPKLHSDEEDRTFVHAFVWNSETWIVLIDGRIAGLASIDGHRLDHLYVHPARRNEGIGLMLLDRVKAQRPNGFDLWTFQANKGARRFYERHGLEAVERTDGSRNEERLPDVRYAWSPVLEV
jgi:GNAT superfamily N-acetyltransferase